MKNDFKNKDFWVKYDSNRVKTYYLRLNGCWMMVTNDIYRIYKNSYQKMYQDEIREKRYLIHYENADDIYSYLNERRQSNPLQFMIVKETKKMIQVLLSHLTLEERYIIHCIYFMDMTEREVAASLHMSQQKLHYRKKKILEKLRYFLLDPNNNFM